MRVSILYIFFIVLLLSCCQEKKYEVVDSVHKNYIDFVSFKDRIAAIDNTQDLVIINLKTNDLQTIAENVVALNSAKDNELIFLKSNGDVICFDIAKNQGRLIGTTSEEVKFIGIVNDELYFITNSEIVEWADQKKFKFRLAESHNDQFSNDQFSFGMNMPLASLVDEAGNIWIGFNYGEFGGDLLAFDPEKEKFLSLYLKDFDFNLHPVESIFQGPENKIYLMFGHGHVPNTGLMEFDHYTANIIFYQNTDLIKVKDEKGREIIRSPLIRQVGPGSFDPKSNSIYFYSEGEILMGNPSQGLSKIDNWAKVVDLTTLQQYGLTVVEDFEDESMMNLPIKVTKLKPIENNSFILLTENDGIGVYKKNKLTLFK